MTSKSTASIPAYAGSTVDVSIIHGGRTTVPTGYLFKTQIPGHEILDIPCYSFLIEHKKSGKRVLYDLGLMKAWKDKLPPAILGQIEYAKAVIDTENNVAEQLTAADVPLESINAIIWSHHHIDHMGDPSLFPPSTSLIVGPGFKSEKTTFPGYPANPDALVVDDAFHGRDLIELDFSTTSVNIGGFPAIDFFNDGSFFILRSQGHTHDHMSALARTAERKFIFLGGDVAHHPAEFRPTSQLPLPTHIDPSILSENPKIGFFPCPATVFETIHPGREKTEWEYKTTPFYELNPLMNASIQDAEAAVEKMQTLDGSAEVFVIISHDSSLLDILPFFPLKLTAWDSAGYKARGRWLFLRDFIKAAMETEDGVSSSKSV